jgi:hypothetical protein
VYGQLECNGEVGTIWKYKIIPSLLVFWVVFTPLMGLLTDIYSYNADIYWGYLLR